MGERWEIRRGLTRGDSLRGIARVVGRPVSTVAREVARNGGRRSYGALNAQGRATRLAKRPKPFTLESNGRLARAVSERLGRRWSPEQIARRLRREHPDDPRWWVSPEAIYRSLYVQGRGGLNRELTAALRSGRARRRGRLERDGRGRLAGMVSISERPAEAADRAVPGHWEGDLIIGSDRRSAIATLVERSTRYTLLVGLPHGHTAPVTRDALARVIATLPDHLRRSLTWDQGKELAEHLQLRIDADIAVYFCDPAKPWQRGTNENTNRLLRQYFPKGTSLAHLGDDDLAAVAAELNGRPRKTLDWATPAEAYAAAVATTP